VFYIIFLAHVLEYCYIGFMNSSKPIKLKKDGFQVMVERLSHMEPKLWDLVEALGKSNGKSRSTQFRLIVKDWYKTKFKNITVNTEIDWSEV